MSSGLGTTLPDASRPSPGRRPPTDVPLGLRGAARALARSRLLWVAGIAVLAIQSWGLVLRGMPWRGDLVWTLDWVPVTDLIVAPVLGGLVAIDVARTQGSGDVLPQRVWRSPAVALACLYAAVAAGAHLVVVALAVGISRPRVWYATWPLVVVVQLLALLLFVAIGLAVGRVLGVVVAGVAGAGASAAAVLLFSTPGATFAPLYQGVATVPRIGWEWSWQSLVAQAVVLLALILACGVIRPAASRRMTAVVGSVAAVCVGAAVAVTLGSPAERWVPDGAEPTFCGGVLTTPVCFFPQHGRVAYPYQEAMAALFEAAQAHGYDELVPGRVEEASRTYWPSGRDVAPLVVTTETLDGSPPSLWEVALGMVQPLHCERLAAAEPPGDRYWEDVHALVGTWVHLADAEEAERNGFVGPELDPGAATALITQLRECSHPELS